MITTETHTREHHCTFDPGELQRIIAEAAAAKVQFGQPKIGRPGVTFTVRFEDTKKGTQATVVIVEDLMPQPTPAEVMEGQS